MTPRPRRKSNRDLPQHLYVRKCAGKIYYYYQDENKKRHAFGSDKNIAIEAARQLNAKRYKGVEDLINQSKSRVGSLGDFVNRFFDEIAAEKQYKPKTKRETLLRLNHICASFDSDIRKIKTIDCAEFLDQWNKTPRQKQSYRSLLIMLFNWAQHKGWCDHNPASTTLPPKVKVQRKRMTLEDYEAIYSCAKPQIQNAMDIALYSLQRLEDVSLLKLSKLKRGYLEIIQEKTGAAIQIECGDNLLNVLNRCRESALRTGAKTFVHQSLSSQRHIRGKPIKGSIISKGLRQARDKANIYPDIPANQRPSFHEIRALGAKLYEEQGADPAAIQALLGHSDIQMTKVYLSRHEKQWTTATANLSI